MGAARRCVASAFCGSLRRALASGFAQKQRIEYFRAKGCTHIRLHASAMGRPLYREAAQCSIHTASPAVGWW
ncbi:MAG: hypothetical protein ACYDHD_10755 [Vulcanimicrobiaceae bacterium]